MLRHFGTFRATACLAGLLCSAFILPAQSVISARSGVVHYVEGRVTLDGDEIHPKFGQFPEVRNGQVLSAGEGRAEVLLTPGVFLRLAENSAFRMDSNALNDTRISMLSGTELIEVVELLENNAVTAKLRDTEISLPKRGIYRVDADNALFRVYEGEARLNPDANAIKVKKGREVNLDADKLETQSFDAKNTDPFYRWSARRASYIAAANVVAARTATRSDSFSSGFFGRSTGSWTWSPAFGMYTFMPGWGMFSSPFGSPFYSPSSIIGVYMPSPRALTPLPGPMNPTGGVSGPPTAGAGQMSGPAPFSPGGPAGASHGIGLAPGAGMRGGHR